MNFKRLKDSVAPAMFNHYVLYVLVCFIMAIAGLEFVAPLNVFLDFVSGATGYEIKEPVSRKYLGTDSILEQIEKKEVLSGIGNEGLSGVSPSDLGVDVSVESIKENAKQRLQDAVDKYTPSKPSEEIYYRTIGMVTLENRDGVFASAFNIYQRRSLSYAVYSGVKTMVHSENAAILLCTVLTVLVSVFLVLFVKRVLKVISRRFFLEARNYKKVPLRRSLYLIRCRHWLNAGFVLTMALLHNFLMCFTIVGGVKYYFAYFAVPYITAENPGAKPKEVLELSKRMMEGHKMECFKLKLSFIGWDLISVMSLGTLGILYVNPYKAAVYCEYFAELRALAVENEIEGCEILNDKYLYEYADRGYLEELYADKLEIMNSEIPEADRRTGPARFFANVFGVILLPDRKEEVYRRYTELRIQIIEARSVIKHEQYPSREFRKANPQKQRHFMELHYLRRYSLTSLVLMFFIFAFIGWLWEVLFHIVEEGRFVNRGVLFGPWLPIYGCGGVLILIVLYKFRSKPWLEAVLTVLMCGIVEYSTSLYLEYKFNEKWWDYTGYFLHIDGRVSAEGLMAFAIGGMAMVYFIGPLVDNVLVRIKKRILIPVCIVLVCLFVADMVHSSTSPNMGSGITEYDMISGAELMENMAREPVN